jgi:RNA polymerase sigma factor (sigma-70 family)
MDLTTLIGRAQRQDLDAFAEITQRFQHMAFGYALAILGDFGQAEDVVQEAFVAAWFGLARLEDPAAFPGWLRGIVRHRAHRVLRRKHLEGLPLAQANGVAAETPEPDRRIEDRRRAGAVLAAITELPEPLREVVTLFYVHECSQQDIATFLGQPVTTVIPMPLTMPFSEMWEKEGYSEGTRGAVQTFYLPRGSASIPPWTRSPRARA